MNITSLEIAQATMDMFFCLFCLIIFVSIKANNPKQKSMRMFVRLLLIATVLFFGETLAYIPQTTKQRKRLWIYSLARKNSKDIQPIVSSHVEAVVLLPWETNPWTVEVGMEAETGEGKRVNYTGKA